MPFEGEFLGGLLPAIPELNSILEAIRKKYSLPELFPLDEPIKQIFLGDEIVSTEEFAKDVKQHILDNMDGLFPKNYVNQYKGAKQSIEHDYQSELRNFPAETQPVMEMFFALTKTASLTVYKTLDAQVDELTRMVCGHLLLGDSMVAPQGWFGQIFPVQSGEETIIHVLINEVSNLDYMFDEIRKAHKRTFGTKQIKINKKTASTAHFLQLARRGSSREFILDEYIRIYQLALPNKKNSPQYAEARNKHWQRLRKRIKKAEEILNAIGSEKK